MTSMWLRFGRQLSYSLNRLVRRIKDMKKQFVLWLFVLAIGYVFVELQRILAEAQISSAEWIGFFMLVGVAIWLWKLGEDMDKAEQKTRLKENEQRDQKLIETLKKVLREDGEKQPKDNNKKAGEP